MKNPDVVVAGGGLVGLSCALFLARAGVKVFLMERGAVGAEASGVNFGNVRRQGRKLAELPLAQRAYTIWGDLKGLVGEECEYVRRGHVVLARTAEELQSLDAYREEASAFGLDAIILDKLELKSRYPWVGSSPVGGSLVADEGSANPRLVGPAFARAAVAAGAVVHERVELVAAEPTSFGFRLRSSDGGTTDCGTLVNTAGAWGTRLAAMLGERLPARAEGPQMGVTEPMPYAIEPTVGVSGSPIYFRQIPRGNVIFGGGARTRLNICSRVAPVEPHNTARQMQLLAEFVPALRHAAIIRVWSGIEAYTPDHLPIIGVSAKAAGLIHAFGFNGHGFELAPAVGESLAELIIRGSTTAPIEAFAPSRFANHKVYEHWT